MFKHAIGSHRLFRAALPNNSTRRKELRIGQGNPLHTGGESRSGGILAFLAARLEMWLVEASQIRDEPFKGKEESCLGGEENRGLSTCEFLSWDQGLPAGCWTRNTNSRSKLSKEHSVILKVETCYG